MTEFGKNFNAVPKPARGALIAAVKSGKVEDVKNLLLRGANVNERDKYDNSLLILATAAGAMEIVRLLIDNNADIDLINEFKVTAEKAAKGRGHPEIFQFLREVPEIRRRAAEEKNRASVLENQRLLNEIARNMHAKSRKHGI